jgi:hypothetical protein
MTQGIEIDAIWNCKNETSGEDYVSHVIATPQFGPKRLFANLDKVAGADGGELHTVICNPTTKTKAPAQASARGHPRSFTDYVLTLSNSAATFFQLSPLPVPPRSV